jgi:hypothetical protein
MENVGVFGRVVLPRVGLPIIRHIYRPIPYEVRGSWESLCYGSQSPSLVKIFGMPDIPGTRTSDTLSLTKELSKKLPYFP